MCFGVLLGCVVSVSVSVLAGCVGGFPTWVCGGIGAWVDDGEVRDDGREG